MLHTIIQKQGRVLSPKTKNTKFTLPKKMNLEGLTKKSWEEFLELYEKNFGDKNKTIKEFGITHKDFNWWFYTIKEFGEKCNIIETMRNNTIEDEIYQILEEKFEELMEDGYPYKDCVSLTGFDPIKHNQKISGNTKHTYLKPPDFWDKYTIKWDPSNPEERLEWELDYREKLLKLRESRFDRNQVNRDKRNQRIQEIRERLRVKNPTHSLLKTNDEIIDWEVEKIRKRTEKKIKELEDRIVKNRVLEGERKKKRSKEQKVYNELVEEREQLRTERYQDVRDKVVERSEKREKERIKREKKKQKIFKKSLEEREQLRLDRLQKIEEFKVERYVERLESKKRSVKIKIDSKKVFEELRKEIINQTIPDDIVNQVKSSNQWGTKFYDVDNKVVFQYCPGCDEHKDRTHFHRNGEKDLVQYCIPCTRKRSGLDPEGGRRGSTYKGIKIKKYNKNGNETHRRCTSCDKFKPTNDFRYKYRTSSICRDCYVQLPNNHLTKPNEWVDGVQMRWYDDLSYEVTHKRCNRCTKKKSRDEFTMRTKSMDGLSGRCKPCEKEVRDKKKN